MESFALNDQCAAGSGASWAELLRKTFGFEIVCQKCQSPLRLIALIKNEDIAKKILAAMHLPAEVPELHPARPPPGADREARDGEEWPEHWLGRN